MNLKANFHFHAAEDINHRISYTIKEGVDYAAYLGFDVLAVTCHGCFACASEDIEYASSKKVLLIPGIELDIYDEKGKRSHIVLLNCDKSSEELSTFSDIARYKKEHPEVFVLAPHPYFYGNFSLRKNLEKHIELFDAIEHSWFYSKLFNRNRKAKLMAIKHNKPLIATSDTHFLDVFDSSYTTIDVTETTTEEIGRASCRERV